jgi:hypothetical protein
MELSSGCPLSKNARGQEREELTESAALLICKVIGCAALNNPSTVKDINAYIHLVDPVQAH